MLIQTTENSSSKGIKTDGEVIFFQDPIDGGNNNIGEFLAIVEALRFAAKHKLDCPIYSDSRTAIAWVRNGKVRSKAMEEGKTSERVNRRIWKALKWLHDNEILMWQTRRWGEIPADFGRK